MAADSSVSVRNIRLGRFITLHYVKTTLGKLGMSFVFSKRIEGVNFAWFKRVVKMRLLDCNIEEWFSAKQGNPLFIHNKLYKSHFLMEHFVTSLPSAPAKYMLRFRTRNMLFAV